MMNQQKHVGVPFEYKIKLAPREIIIWFSKLSSTTVGSQRKQSPGKRKKYKNKKNLKLRDIDSVDQVGSKLKVWGPADKTHYEWVVDSFDLVKQKNKGKKY